MASSWVKRFVTGERYNQKWCSRVNSFGHICRVWSGLKSLVTDERFAHGWKVWLRWSHVNGLVKGEWFGARSRMSGLVTNEEFCHV